MQPASVDFHPQQLFEPYIGKPHITPEVIDQRELTELVRRFEGEPVETERHGEALDRKSVV